MDVNLLIIIYIGLISTSLFLNIIFPYRQKWFKKLFQSLVHHGKILRNLSRESDGSTNVFAKLTVPKKWFAYFYLWGTIWTVAVILSVNSLQYNYTKDSSVFTSICTLMNALYFPSKQVNNLVSDKRPLTFNVQMVLFFIFLQVSRRCFESFYVMSFGSSRMHFGHFLFGVFFYTSLPLLALLQQKQQRPLHNMTTGLDWYHGIALLLFIFANWHQHICHVILANMKREQLSTGSYSIPQNDWFNYVSCPHYTAEILVYCSLFICSGFSNYYLFLPLFSTSLSLTAVARETHYWYRKNFKNYPKNRKMIIPFLY